VPDCEYRTVPLLGPPCVQDGGHQTNNKQVGSSPGVELIMWHLRIQQTADDWRMVPDQELRHRVRWVGNVEKIDSTAGLTEVSTLKQQITAD
jgi:hypothetical protein